MVFLHGSHFRLYLAATCNREALSKVVGAGELNRDRDNQIVNSSDCDSTQTFIVKRKVGTMATGKNNHLGTYTLDLLFVLLRMLRTLPRVAAWQHSPEKIVSRRQTVSLDVIANTVQ